MTERLHFLSVRETDNVAFLINTCRYSYQHYFANNSLKVFSNGVDLSTLNQRAKLADVDIRSTTTLHAEADTSSNNITSSALSLTVKQLGRADIPITNAYSHWYVNN